MRDDLRVGVAQLDAHVLADIVVVAATAQARDFDVAADGAQHGGVGDLDPVVAGAHGGGGGGAGITQHLDAAAGGVQQHRGLAAVADQHGIFVGPARGAGHPAIDQDVAGVRVQAGGAKQVDRGPPGGRGRGRVAVDGDVAIAARAPGVQRAGLDAHAIGVLLGGDAIGALRGAAQLDVAPLRADGCVLQQDGARVGGRARHLALAGCQGHIQGHRVAIGLLARDLAWHRLGAHDLDRPVGGDRQVGRARQRIARDDVEGVLHIVGAAGVEAAHGDGGVGLTQHQLADVVARGGQLQGGARLPPQIDLVGVQEHLRGTTDGEAAQGVGLGAHPPVEGDATRVVGVAAQEAVGDGAGGVEHQVTRAVAILRGDLAVEGDVAAAAQVVL